jgi:hypothetical protein
VAARFDAFFRDPLVNVCFQFSERHFGFRFVGHPTIVLR